MIMFFGILFVANMVMTNFDFLQQNIQISMDCKNEKNYVFSIKNENSEMVL